MLKLAIHEVTFILHYCPEDPPYCHSCTSLWCASTTDRFGGLELKLLEHIKGDIGFVLLYHDINHGFRFTEELTKK